MLEKADIDCVWLRVETRTELLRELEAFSPDVFLIGFPFPNLTAYPLLSSFTQKKVLTCLSFCYRAR
jgi:hypothetical protein